MTRFQIEFEGRVDGSVEHELDEALDVTMGRLVDLGVADPSVSGSLGSGDLQVAFVVDAASTQEALERGHSILREVTSVSPLVGASWTAARAESLQVPSRASG